MSVMLAADAACPCGSGLAYGHCCQPLHEGAAAQTPEALMRSRYSAFVLQNEDYLHASWHSSTRPDGDVCDGESRWLGLTVVSSSVNGDEGEVSFVARFALGEGKATEWQQLSERSRFVREQGHWFYLDGVPSWTSFKPGRNDDCPCGSGRKFKKCCG